LNHPRGRFRPRRGAARPRTNERSPAVARLAEVATTGAPPGTVTFVPQPLQGAERPAMDSETRNGRPQVTHAKLIDIGQIPHG
jgi:hypothetical protein